MDQPDCLCLHPLAHHAEGLRCMVAGCTCANYEADPCGAEPSRHSQHDQPVLGCLDCEDLLEEARELDAEKPWEAA